MGTGADETFSSGSPPPTLFSSPSARRRSLRNLATINLRPIPVETSAVMGRARKWSLRLGDSGKSGGAEGKRGVRLLFSPSCSRLRRKGDAGCYHVAANV